MRLSSLTAAAVLALACLAACGTAEPPVPAPSESDTDVAATATASESPTAIPSATPSEIPSATPVEQTSAPDIDPRLAILVGTWEADVEEVGPHGSTLEIFEDGTASLATFLNQHGPYEGVIILGTADPHRFEGTEAETCGQVVIEFGFDPEADTLTLEYEGGAYVHTRA
ncbi:hypothetical protein [Glycomyces sp. NRRL B-16210]|uniref:hypothetical protein n=1 Tax=Glycomyces sp. NRRL B-16210 TaxID=1463821 RepID=UPI0004BE4F2E|nr:hypothetical protein [Glycomyces sp. NRRL B-16210]